MHRNLILAACAFTAVAMASASTATAAIVYGVTTTNTLFRVDSSAPGAILSGFAISGFSANNENIVAIDFRPLTNELYALGSFGQVYTVNLATAALTAVGAGIGPINGTAFGFDFNPSIDRIRLVTDVNKNYVINPITGALQAAATDLFFGPADPNFGVDPNVVGSAYSNNMAGVGATQLYGIDSGLDILVTQANSAGTLGTIGPLGLNTGNLVGLDIDSPAVGVNMAYASLTPTGGSVSNLYSINLVTGLATNLGSIGGGTLVTDIAVIVTNEGVIIPEPTGFGIAAAAFAAKALRRRR